MNSEHNNYRLMAWWFLVALETAAPAAIRLYHQAVASCRLYSALQVSVHSHNYTVHSYCTVQEVSTIIDVQQLSGRYIRQYSFMQAVQCTVPSY